MQLADALQVDAGRVVVEKPVEVGEGGIAPARLPAQYRPHPALLVRFGIHGHDAVQVSQHAIQVLLALGDVREQVYKAEVTEYKESLKGRESVIAGLLARIRAGQAAPG